ncbi:MAG: phosphotransferase [Pseudomonadales bacterium]|nr:phosphotransferase [Pseudomonadales bacterium]NIX07514.1 phosphotransferase [Pseudomonadales bacterium]
MAGIPETPEDFTTSWLCEVLGVPEDDISDVNVRTSEADSGFVSLACFLELETRPGADIPRRLVGKLAPTFEAARNMVREFGLFAREKQFYSEVAPLVAIRSPRAYHSDYDAELGTGVLLLEDCSHMRAPVQTDEQPTTLEELETIVDAAAKMAISSWNAEWLATMDELMGPGHPAFEGYFSGIQEGYKDFVDSEFMSWAPDGFEDLAVRLGDDMHKVASAQPESNLSLCHLDLRLANVFFDVDSDDPVVLFDWQSMYPGRTAQDLGYLITSGYTPEFRREHERSLVLRYHQRLVEAGITDYSFDEAWLDYLHGILIGLRLLPMALGDLDLSTEGGQAIFRKIIRNFPQAALDHGGVDLVDEVLSRRS